jgi:RNA polymerase sigma factor (sigma-70 family)
LRSDEQLVALFRAGQDEAFRAIHDRYRARLFAYARQMLPGRQDAEDALQDVFLRAYAGLRSSDRELALRAWLYRVAHNRCIDELRRPVAPPERIHLCPPLDDPVAHADQRESLRRLIGDIRRLPDQQRSALLMRELGGMSYAEVASALGVSVPAIKSLLVRARIGLVQAMEARDTACSEIRTELMLAHDRRVRPGARARRHMRDCDGCREFRRDMRGVSRQLAALAPALGPLGMLAKLLGLGTGGGAAAGGGSAAASGATGGTGAVASGAVGGTGAVAGGAVGGTGAVAGGAVASAGALTGVGHVATLLAATVVAAGGAVELQHTITTAPRPAHHGATRSTSHPSTRLTSDVFAPVEDLPTAIDRSAPPTPGGTASRQSFSPPGSSSSSMSATRTAGTGTPPTRVTSGIGINDQLAGNAPLGGPVDSTPSGTGTGSSGGQGGTSSNGTPLPTGPGTTTGTGGPQGGIGGGACAPAVTTCQTGSPQPGSFGGGTSTGGTTGSGSTGGGTTGGGTSAGGTGGGSSPSAP